jgi:protein TonB
MTRLFHCCAFSSVLIALLFLVSCGAPAPAPVSAPPTPGGTPPAPIVKAPIETIEARPPSPPTPSARLAPLDPALEDWKRSAAQKVHAVNRAQLFEGRPEHLLRAVIVVEVTVDRDGKVARSKVLRSPGIASLDSMALASLKAASPLPAPPTRLVAKGPLVFSETWLVRKDGRFQLRSLALPQE